MIITDDDTMEIKELKTQLAHDFDMKDLDLYLTFWVLKLISRQKAIFYLSPNTLPTSLSMLVLLMIGLLTLLLSSMFDVLLQMIFSYRIPSCIVLL